jgi:hypothetical protein
MAEGYFQHAEHYFRILNAMNQAQQQQQQQHPPRRNAGPMAADAEGGEAVPEQPEMNGQANGHATVIEMDQPDLPESPERDREPG